MKVRFVGGGLLDGEIVDIADGQPEWVVEQPVPGQTLDALNTGMLVNRGRYHRVDESDDGLLQLHIPFAWKGWDRPGGRG